MCVSDEIKVFWRKIQVCSSYFYCYFILPIHSFNFFLQKVSGKVLCFRTLGNDWRHAEYRWQLKLPAAQVSFFLLAKTDRAVSDERRCPWSWNDLHRFLNAVSTIVTVLRAETLYNRFSNISSLFMVLAWGSNRATVARCLCQRC